jgi:nicotinamidase-related amidase
MVEAKTTKQSDHWDPPATWNFKLCIDELAEGTTDRQSRIIQEALVMKSLISFIITVVVLLGLMESTTQAQLPDPGITVETERTAVVITDPQNDFLSPNGATWSLVGASVTANNTVENIESLIKAAKSTGMLVFISPHYYYPTDHGWQFGGAVEKMMHSINMFDRSGALTMEGFRGSGADWLDRFRVLIEDENTVVVSPHKVYGPETNDLVLQLRKRGIDKVILGGMSANLCTESHLRELLEQGFEVAVVTDATAAAQTPDIDGYAAALTNFRFLANATWSTAEAINNIKEASEPSSASK